MDDSVSLDALFSASRRLPPLAAEDYMFDPQDKQWVPLSTVRKLPKAQRDRLHQARGVVQKAASAQSRCRHCGGKISKGELRVGYPTADPRGEYGLLTCWLHATVSCSGLILEQVLGEELGSEGLKDLRSLLHNDAASKDEKKEVAEAVEATSSALLKGHSANASDGSPGAPTRTSCDLSKAEPAQVKTAVKEEKQEGEGEKEFPERCSSRSRRKGTRILDVETGPGVRGTSHTSSGSRLKEEEESQDNSETECGRASVHSVIQQDGRVSTSKVQECPSEAETAAPTTPVSPEGARRGSSSGSRKGPPNHLSDEGAEDKTNAQSPPSRRNGGVGNSPFSSDTAASPSPSSSGVGDSHPDNTKQETLQNEVAKGDSEKEIYACDAHRIFGEALQIALVFHGTEVLDPLSLQQLKAACGAVIHQIVAPEEAAKVKRTHGQKNGLDSNGSGDISSNIVDGLVKRKIEGRRPAPPELLLPLLPFQEEGLWWMCRQEQSEVRGGILADEMGMGKTIQLISLILARPFPPLPPALRSDDKHSRQDLQLPRVGRTLVVTPLAALLQWKGELEKFVKPGHLSILVYHGVYRKDLGTELEKYDVVLTTYQTIEQEYRRETNKHKVMCKYCGRLYLPEKLGIHHRYFCGPLAARTAKQRLTSRKQGTQKAMRTLHITSAKDEELTKARHDNSKTASSSSSSSSSSVSTKKSTKRSRQSGEWNKEDLSEANSHRQTTSPSSSSSSSSTISGGSRSFVPTPSNVMRELMAEANRDIRDMCPSWVFPVPLRFTRRTPYTPETQASRPSGTGDRKSSRDDHKQEGEDSQSRAGGKGKKKSPTKVTPQQEGETRKRPPRGNKNDINKTLREEDKYNNEDDIIIELSDDHHHDDDEPENSEEIHRVTQTLVDMGFNEDEALAAALSTEGQIDEAVRLLSEKGRRSPVRRPASSASRQSMEEEQQQGEESNDEESQEIEAERQRAFELRKQINLAKSDIPKQKMPVLQALLRRCGVPTSGSKQQLVTRLTRLLFGDGEEEDEVKHQAKEEDKRSQAMAARVSSTPRRARQNDRWDKRSHQREVKEMKEENNQDEENDDDDDGDSKQIQSAPRRSPRLTGSVSEGPTTKTTTPSCSTRPTTPSSQDHIETSLSRQVGAISPRPSLKRIQGKKSPLKKGEETKKKGSKKLVVVKKSGSSKKTPTANKAVKEGRGKAKKTMRKSRNVEEEDEDFSPSSSSSDPPLSSSDSDYEVSDEESSASSSHHTSSSSFDSEDDFSDESDGEAVKGADVWMECKGLNGGRGEGVKSKKKKLQEGKKASSSSPLRTKEEDKKEVEEAEELRGGWIEEEDPHDAVVGHLLKRSHLHSIYWQRLVLDEAHRIKSRASSTAQAVLALRTATLVCHRKKTNSSSSPPASCASETNNKTETDERERDGLINEANIEKTSLEEDKDTSLSSSSSSKQKKAKKGVEKGKATTKSDGKTEKNTKNGEISVGQGLEGKSDETPPDAHTGHHQKVIFSSKQIQTASSSRGDTEALDSLSLVESSGERRGNNRRKEKEEDKEKEEEEWELKIGGSRWCLTGTPLQNRVGELFSLVKFLRLYPYAYYFCKQAGCTCRSLHFRFHEGKFPLWVDTPVLSSLGSLRFCMKCHHARMSHFSLFNQKVINPIKRCGYQNEGIVALNNLKREVLDVVLLRRTKVERAADVKLPPLTVRIRRDELSPEERDFYESLFKQTAIQFDAYVEAGTVLHNFAHIFDLLSRLRQAVDHPYLLIHGSLMPLDGNTLLPTASRKETSVDVCALCQDDVLHADHLVEASCGHAFHRACLKEYVASVPIEADPGANKKKEVLGCPACYTPLTVDLSVIARQGDEDDDDEEDDDESKGRAKGRGGKGRGGGGGGKKRGRGTSVSLSSSKEQRKNQEEDEEEEEEEEEGLNEGDDDTDVKKRKTEETMKENEEKKGSEGDSAVGAEGDKKFSSYNLDSLLQAHQNARRAGGIMRRVKASEFRSSTKIEALYQELMEVEAQDKTIKSLVFSQFCSMLDLIEWRLKKGGIHCAKLVGSMSVVSRSNVLYAFNNDPSLKVLLISLKAGGEGLNLQVASRIFLMDPWWNPAAEMQAIQRAHRIGQRHKEVVAVRFIAEKTIEERILQLQEKKQLVFDGTVGASDNAMAKLTQDDLRFLFQS